jgi:hypothetical protein
MWVKEFTNTMHILTLKTLIYEGKNRIKLSVTEFVT